jgi:hypothetical protein
MKKIFTFNVENKTRERQLDWTKHEIRKYIKREKRKKLPEGFDYWKFECQFACNKEAVMPIEFLDITKHIDAAFEKNSDEFYIEIIATPAIKQPKEENGDAEEIK